MSGNTRNFTMVAPVLHSSRRFLDLDDSGRALFIYLLTGPHQTSCGCSQIKPGYACADLGPSWPLDKYQRHLAALETAGLIIVDDDEIYIERWFKHNSKGSWKYAKAIQSQIDKIESDMLREKVSADFAATELGQAAYEAGEAEKAADRSTPANVSNRLLSTGLMRRGA
ncbi:MULTISPECIES: hypothetical protein [unclassified Mesorhizobium]|uniref:hypothetical protein n=1 Tax=unclassified Mesorhizobium TaxID=325217 RepID=UPI0010934174|nr:MULTISPECIES: hypothetical protein [unclassified Mesorhizobium]TGS46018.1 hypothetical protein EN825_10355 [Mesorhizobium sp. M8A.F.Ca.ET.182.01.1.1]TGS81473.1 hypothetical protein EN824_10570 [Mesorhizobium sp. M8A.F.Ca.ET.181.01.1.1]